MKGKIIKAIMVLCVLFLFPAGGSQANTWGEVVSQEISNHSGEFTTQAIEDFLYPLLTIFEPVGYYRDSGALLSFERLGE